MRAIVMSELGPPEVLVATDVPDPVLGADQALIDVEFAGVTFVDTQIRAGHPPRPEMSPALPAIPGNGVGGVVAAVGEEADGALVGRRVIAPTGGTGGYAERAAAPAGGAIEIPEELGTAEAVALLADGRTALILKHLAAIQPGEVVLVEAAAGGVGTLLVQFARNLGATVVAAAGSAAKLDVGRQLGAEHAVDYRRPGWSTQVREALGGVDVVFDGVGGEIGTEAFGLLRPGGRMLRYGRASGSWSAVSEEDAARRGVSLLGLRPPAPAEARELSNVVLTHAAAGRIQPLIGQTFPLAEAARAHAAIEARTVIGKTLLRARDRP